MQVKRLVLHQFRNIEELSIEPHPGVNVIHGRNAQGKTNVLEALYLSATLKSFRGAKNAELIEIPHSEAAVRTIIERRELSRDILIRIKPGGKYVTMDEKKVRNLTDYFGQVAAVVFSPEDLILSKGSASNRRTFLDRAVFQMNPQFASTMRAFDQALKNRNSIIKELRKTGQGNEMLDLFDPQVAELGSKIIWSRLQFLKGYRPYLADAYQTLSNGEQSIAIGYESDLDIEETSDLETIQHAYEQVLQSNRKKDIQRGFTTSGPQSEDLTIELDGMSARAYASQGQHRSIVLAMKMGEIQHLGEVLEVQPIFLLDDVSSELDHKRNAQLMQFLSERPGQIFVTTTDPAYLQLDCEVSLFHMNNGVLTDERNSL